MHWIDYTIIFGYMVAVFGIGTFFLKKQTSVDEFFVGNRKMGWGHISFSVVATDVGGGFSIGLGGLGYVMGLSGSWLLFTGLIGAWLSAVVLIPKVKRLGDAGKFLTFPDFLHSQFDERTRTMAALVSGIGYSGFVGGQVLAGGKLCSSAFGIGLVPAVLVMSTVIILYTSFGGLEAVVYTDTLQWVLLLVGLTFFALPFGYVEVGGWRSIRAALPPAYFSLTNVAPSQFLAWMFSIIPIWFVGMTLYQRIYATRDLKTARRAWYVAGLLEWPLMSFLGVTLGMFSRVIYPHVDAEMGLPLLIRNVLPTGVVGIVMAAYFAAIMSTADSCLLAAAGNFTNDIYQRYINPKASEKRVLAVSRTLTVTIGFASVALALLVPNVLEVILLSYAFMVSGLFVPTIAALTPWPTSSRGAVWSIIVGGSSAVLMQRGFILIPFNEPIFWSLPLAALFYLFFFFRDKNRRDREAINGLQVSTS